MNIFGTIDELHAFCGTLPASIGQLSSYNVGISLWVPTLDVLHLRLTACHLHICGCLCAYLGVQCGPEFTLLHSCGEHVGRAANGSIYARLC